FREEFGVPEALASKTLRLLGPREHDGIHGGRSIDRRLEEERLAVLAPDQSAFGRVRDRDPFDAIEDAVEVDADGVVVFFFLVRRVGFPFFALLLLLRFVLLRALALGVLLLHRLERLLEQLVALRRFTRLLRERDPEDVGLPVVAAT